MQNKGPVENTGPFSFPEALRKKVYEEHDDEDSDDD